MKYTIELTEEQGIMMKELIEKRKTMDRRCTHLPFYSVQTKESRPVMEGYGEDEIIIVHSEEGDEVDYSSRESILELADNYDMANEEMEELIEEIDLTDVENVTEFLNEHFKSEYGHYYSVPIEYYYKDVAFFLTEQEAFSYCKYQSHNLCEPRTYGHSTGYANKGYFPSFLDMLDKIEVKEDDR